MYNPSLKFRESFIFSRKPSYSSAKFWQAATTIEFNIFCWCLHLSPTYQCLQKGVQGLFILFRSRVIDKPGFCEWVETRSFYFGNTFLNTLVSRKRVQNFNQKNIKVYGSWRSIFQEKLPGFSKTIESCLNIWDFVLLNNYYQITKNK